jgi:uncharacterized membrane protein
LLHQNQTDIAENLAACMEIIRKIGEASESVARTAHTLMKGVEFFTAKTRRNLENVRTFHIAVRAGVAFGLEGSVPNSIFFTLKR